MGLSRIKQEAYVMLLVGNIALEQVPLRALRFYIASYSSNIPFSCIVGDDTIDAFQAAVPRDSSPHHIYK